MQIIKIIHSVYVCVCEWKYRNMYNETTPKLQSRQTLNSHAGGRGVKTHVEMLQNCFVCWKMEIPGKWVSEWEWWDDDEKLYAENLL